jgi:hypothetical protein
VLIGVDFDNTIVCYDELFRTVSGERGLVPTWFAPSKSAVRDYLRHAGQEDRWTELQGVVYGSRMREARPFDGVLDFFLRCKALCVPVVIVSHRTRYPYVGPRHDLHQSAREWLALYGFYDPAQIGLGSDQVYLEPTKEAKLARIAGLSCSHFIDDLPELLEEPGFAAGVERILFDPNGMHLNCKVAHRVDSWQQIDKRLLPEES